MYLFFISKSKDSFHSKCIFHVKFYPSDIDPLCSEPFVLPEMANIGAMLLAWLPPLLIFELSGLTEGTVNSVSLRPSSLRLLCLLPLRRLESPRSPKLTFKNTFEVSLSLSVRVVCPSWLLLLFLVRRISLCLRTFCLLLVSLIFGFGLLRVFVSLLELDLWVVASLLELEASDLAVELFLLSLT